MAESTRPDIASAATTISGVLPAPTKLKSNWKLQRRLAQDFYKTKENSVVMEKGNQRIISITAYLEAEFSIDETSTKSIAGMITLFNGSLVQWLAR